LQKEGFYNRRLQLAPQQQEKMELLAPTMQQQKLGKFHDN